MKSGAIIVGVILLVLFISPTVSAAESSGNDGGFFSSLISPFKKILTFFKNIIFRPSTEFDFKIDVVDPVVTVKQDVKTEVKVGIKDVRGEFKPVTLTVTKWPTASITSEFKEATFRKETSTFLYLATTCATPPGEYLHTVQGESGLRTSVDSVNLIVKENSDCKSKTPTPPPITSAPTPAPHITSTASPLTPPPTTTPPEPEVSLAISAKGECIIHKRFTDEYGLPKGDFSNMFSGSASGPVGAYLVELINPTQYATNFNGNVNNDCGAWGSNCQRDTGEPEKTDWYLEFRSIGSSTTWTYDFSVCTAECENKEETEKYVVLCKV